MEATFTLFSLASVLLILLIAAVTSAAAAKVDTSTLLSAKPAQADAYGQPAYVPECDPDWVAVSSPNPGTGLNVLTGVAAVSTSDVWAVGYYQSSSLYQTVTLHWDGSAWNVVPSPNVGSDSNYLNSVVAISANDVWAVGSYGDGTATSETLVLHWDGSSWSVVPSPSVGSSFNCPEFGSRSIRRRCMERGLLCAEQSHTHRNADRALGRQRLEHRPQSQSRHSSQRCSGGNSHLLQ